MKTLEQFNEERRKRHQEANLRMNTPQPNGIQCPKCGAELFDSNPRMTLTSNPPQMNVHCDECDYKGFRVA